MPHWTAIAPTVLASFMASLVEFVEALTIVLAVGAERGWRSALLGAGAALVVLVALIATLGPLLTRIPLPPVRFFVGTLLLLFGLRWLRKAVLRSAGVLALHDEADAYRKETESLRGRGARRHGALDTVAFFASFKIVMLEGIEVVFIVIAIGASGSLIIPASAGALLALLAVALLGLVLHRPLARVPENALKFGVGVMLCAFGTFWVGEGVGIEWPGADGAAPALIAAWLAFALALVPICRRLRRRERLNPPTTSTGFAGIAPALQPTSGSASPSVSTSASPVASTSTAASASGPKSVLASIAEEVLGLFVDDGWLAGGVLVWIAAIRLARSWPPISGTSAAFLFAAGLGASLALSAARRARDAPRPAHEFEAARVN